MNLAFNNSRVESRPFFIHVCDDSELHYFIGLVTGLTVGWFVTMVVLAVLIQKHCKEKRKCFIENYLKAAESLKHSYDIPIEMSLRRPLPTPNELEPDGIGKSGSYMDITDDAYSEEAIYIDVLDKDYSERTNSYRAAIPDRVCSFSYYSTNMTHHKRSESREVLDVNKQQKANHVLPDKRLNTHDPDSASGGADDKKCMTKLKRSDNHLVQGTYLEQVRAAKYTMELVYEGPD